MAEFYSCDREILDNVDYVKSAMLEAARRTGATIVTETFHHFSPHGVSGAVIIAESHLAIHTWPEFGYAAVDLFTCGDTVSSEAGFSHLRQALRAGHVSTMELHRGQVDMMGTGHKPESAKALKTADRVRRGSVLEIGVPGEPRPDLGEVGLAPAGV